MTFRRIAVLGCLAAMPLLLGASVAGAGTLSRSESNLLRAVNDARIEHGLPPLRVDYTLERAARSHSTSMIDAGYFAHGDFGSRMAAFGVRGTIMGENLAWGSGPYQSATSIVTEWLNSPEHRANLLRPSFTRIGIGASSGRFLGHGDATVVTADFAGT